MTTTKMKGGSAMGTMSDMHKGMWNKSPKASDASTKLGGKNIDQDATRSGVGSKVRVLGPRNA